MRPGSRSSVGVFRCRRRAREACAEGGYGVRQGFVVPQLELVDGDA